MTQVPSATPNTEEKKNNDKKIMLPCMPLVRCCEPCLKTEKSGKILRGTVVISNILYWFSGCAIFSVSIWLKFVDVVSSKYFSTFDPYNVALYVILVTSILILVIAFVGTCAANTKSQPLLAFYSLAVIIVVAAEIISLIVFVGFHEKIETDFGIWYNKHFVGYFDNDTLHSNVVDSVQKKIGCCGLYGIDDFVKESQIIPPSCTIPSKNKQQFIIQPKIYNEGCVKKMDEFIEWLLRGWPIPFAVSMLMIIELLGIISSFLFLLHIFIRRYYNYDDDDEESNGLINNMKKPAATFPAIQADINKIIPVAEELPKPKVFRIPKAAEDKTFGFTIMFDHVKRAHVTHDIEQRSNAEFANLLPNSHIIEMNGMMVQGTNSEEVNMKMESAGNEIRLLVIEEEASIIYKMNKVAVNLRNVQGVTCTDVEYRPRLCIFKKGLRGFGFHLLYLEDRKGEYIEDVAVKGPAEKAGLKIGDRIVEVNGVNIEQEKSKEVVTRIRESGDTISMLVLDPKADGYYRKKAVTVTPSLAVEFFENLVPSAPLTPKKSRRKNQFVKPRYCRLIKGAREDFGLYVVIDNSRIGQVIRWVDCGGPADRAGLHIGDRIVEVNGQNVEYESHQKLIDAIAISKKASHFIVVDEEYDRVFKRNKPRLCRIFKERGLFGFAVNYSERKDGHYVEEVDVDGPAERAGLKIGDRVIQINNVNVSHDDNETILNRLRACASEVVLLVIDARSDRHYKNIKKFRSTGMADIDYDTISIPEEPLFLPDEEDTVSEASDMMTMTMSDSISMAETKSFSSMGTSVTGQSVSESESGDSGYIDGPRVCNLMKMEHEEYGFFLIVDRDRNGQVIQRVEPGSPAELCGLRNGDRILSINNQKVDRFNHEQVVELIKKSGNEIAFVVLDERSDDISNKRRPFLFRIMKGDGGYGFYMWHDEDGHYVEDITIDSPADRAGLRSGDRIIEINGVNIENESHEDVFYRVKACINAVTLLAVDSKTFAYYKKNGIPVSSFKAESSFSGYEKNSKTADKETPKASKKVSTIKQDVRIDKSENENFGFHLAYSESFMGDNNNGEHVIHWVEKGGPAELCGVRNGDKIVAVNGVDITNEDHETVYGLIFESRKNSLILSTEFENTEDLNAPHKVDIKKENDSLGFYLWFDENGHYIEDVTLGSAADKSGLKIGDRLLEVNGVDIEDEVHATVVSLVKESGENVVLTVVSVESEKNLGSKAPVTFSLSKQHGSFGFSIINDANGFHVDEVRDGGAADLYGIKVGDRLLEINGDSIIEIEYSEVINRIKMSGESVQLTILSSSSDVGSLGRVAGKKLLGKNTSPNNSSKSIFQQLLGQDKIDYIVEKRKYQEAKGTDLRKKTKNATESDDESVIIAGKRGKTKKKSRKPNKKTSKLHYTKGEDNIAFVNEVDDEYTTNLQKEYEEADEDKEGAFLDDKIKRTGIHATRLRKPRKPGGKLISQKTANNKNRNRSLSEIENNLESSKSATMRRRRQMQGNKKKQQRGGKAGEFHFASSKKSVGQYWSFEQTDSRRPGEVKSVKLTGDVTFEKRSLGAIAEEDDLSEEFLEANPIMDSVFEENKEEISNDGIMNVNTDNEVEATVSKEDIIEDLNQQESNISENEVENQIEVTNDFKESISNIPTSNKSTEQDISNFEEKEMDLEQMDLEHDINKPTKNVEDITNHKDYEMEDISLSNGEIMI